LLFKIHPYTFLDTSKSGGLSMGEGAGVRFGARRAFDPVTGRTEARFGVEVVNRGNVPVTVRGSMIVGFDRDDAAALDNAKVSAELRAEPSASLVIVEPRERSALLDVVLRPMPLPLVLLEPEGRSEPPPADDDDPAVLLVGFREVADDDGGF